MTAVCLTYIEFKAKTIIEKVGLNTDKLVLKQQINEALKTAKNQYRQSTIHEITDRLNFSKIKLILCQSKSQENEKTSPKLGAKGTLIKDYYAIYTKNSLNIEKMKKSIKTWAEDLNT